MKLIFFTIMFLIILYSVNATGEFLNMSLVDSVSNVTYIDGARDLVVDINDNVVYIASINNDRLTKYNITNGNIGFIGSVAVSDGAGSLDLIRRLSVDTNNNICYGSSYADDYLSLYNCTPNNPTVLGTVLDATYLNGIWDVDYFYTATTQYAITASQLNDYISTWNVTNPTITPVRINSYADSAPPCSVDNPNEMTAIYGTSLLLVASLLDDEITMLNISETGIISCLNSTGTKTSGTGSLEDPESFYYEDSTGLLYGLSRADKQLSIYNWSNPSLTPTLVGNATLTGFPISDVITTIGTDKYAFIGYNNTGGIGVYNVTNPTTPILVQTWNTSAGSCVYNQVYSMRVTNNYLYVISSLDDCFYTIKLYDYLPELSCLYGSTSITKFQYRGSSTEMFPMLINVTNQTDTVPVLNCSNIGFVSGTLQMSRNDTYESVSDICGVPHMSTALTPLLDTANYLYNLTNNGAIYNNTEQWYNFDTSDYMTRANFNNTWTEYTESVWIYPTSSNANNIIFDISLAGTYNNRTYTSRLQTGYIRFSFANTTSSVYIDSTSTVPLNTWTHILASYNGTNITIYLNGVLSKTGGLTGSMITNGRTLFIGASGDLSTKWNGSIDDIRIFNRSLEQWEITALYNNLSITEGLVASYPFSNTTSVSINEPNIYLTTSPTNLTSLGSDESTGIWCTRRYYQLPPAASRKSISYSIILE